MIVIQLQIEKSETGDCYISLCGKLTSKQELLLFLDHIDKFKTLF